MKLLVRAVVATSGTFVLVAADLRWAVTVVVVVSSCGFLSISNHASKLPFDYGGSSNRLL